MIQAFLRMYPPRVIGSNFTEDPENCGRIEEDVWRDTCGWYYKVELVAYYLKNVARTWFD